MKIGFISLSAYKVREKSFRSHVCFFGGYNICFGLTKAQSWVWHIYFSRNATPWASTIYFGTDWREAIAARIRRKKFGLLFNPSDESAVDAAIEISKKMSFI